ncbi:lipid A deacylase LpxR family protein [Acetobacteraceae bacterium H6797]|nr:lipid A deacylase LpxR family protein [Acetobacteraceae bacterium H6797]
MRARPHSEILSSHSVSERSWLALVPALGLGLAIAFASPAARSEVSATGGETPLVTTPPEPLPPPPDPQGTWSLQVENDILNGTDRYYTNGLQLSWRSPSDDLPSPLAWLNQRLDFIQGPGTLRWGLALGHSIFTPQDTQRRNPDPTDRPYAGLLYGAASISRETATTLSVLELQLGMVGPSALGEQVQNNWHRFIGVDTAKGWDYQIKDEPVGALIIDRKWRLPLLMVGNVELEALPSASASLGNLQTYAAGGGLIRFGQGLDADFGPARIRPALAGSAFFQPKENSFGWYIFAGAEGRAIARDILLDGNTWRDSRSVDKRPLVADFQFGAAVIWRGIRFSYTQVIRTEEFYGQRGGMQEFGSFSVSLRF